MRELFEMDLRNPYTLADNIERKVQGKRKHEVNCNKFTVQFKTRTAEVSRIEIPRTGKNGNYQNGSELGQEM